MAKRNKTIEDRLKVSEIKPEEETKIEETKEEEIKEEETKEEETKEEETKEEETKEEETKEEETKEEEIKGEDETYKELLGKIEGAEAPPKTKRERKPVIERTTKKKKKGESSPESFRVEGYILMLLVDTVFPFALSTINNMLDKRIKIQSYQLALDDKDFKKLEPLADQAADYMAVNLNPIAGFFLVATFMYGNNVINLRMQVEQGLK
jgi:hypothetical protein